VTEAVAAPSRPGPWIYGDRLAVLTLNVLAVVAVFVCWVGSATEVAFRDSLLWLQGAIVAVVVASVADAVWLLAGMRALRERRRALVLQWPAAAPGRVARSREDAPDLVTGERMTAFHRPSCLLVRAKEVRQGSRRDFERERLTPCGMCGA
jgi:hypothetical protein